MEKLSITTLTFSLITFAMMIYGKLCVGAFCSFGTKIMLPSVMYITLALLMGVLLKGTNPVVYALVFIITLFALLLLVPILMLYYLSF